MASRTRTHIKIMDDALEYLVAPTTKENEVIKGTILYAAEDWEQDMRKHEKAFQEKEGQEAMRAYRGKHLCMLTSFISELIYEGGTYREIIRKSQTM